MQKIVLTGSLSILVATVAFAYNISHPNLKDAYGAVDQAIQHIQAAATENKDQFGGHAHKAIELLGQVKNELIEGDKYNDALKKKK